MLFDNLAKGDPLSIAASKAGYKFGVGHGILSSPRFQAFMQIYMREQLATDVIRAREVLRGFVDDAKLPPAPRIDAGKTLQAWEKQYRVEGGGPDKPLSEMTGDELQIAISRMQREIGVRAEGAKVIEDNAPVIDVEIVQEPDILG